MPGLLGIIGHERPVCVVCNKVYVILKDNRGYLEQIKKSLVDELEKTRVNQGNIKHICLISATTHYGVEQLTSTLSAALTRANPPSSTL